MKVSTQKELVLEEELPESDIYTKYAYVLAEKNAVRGKIYDENGNSRGEQEYKPFLNVLLSSSVIWPGGTDPFSKKERSRGRYQFRFYDGCSTLFVDDQPKDKETIDQFVSGTRSVEFNHGFLYVYGYDNMLKTYLDWCSYNENSPYRVPSSTVKFKNVDNKKEMEAKADILEMEDTARDLAKNAPLKKMRIHCKFLNIQMEDEITSNTLSEKEIRTFYREYAKNNAAHFIKTYKDEALEIKTWVRDAVNSGKINTSLVPNSAVWSASNAIICSVGNIKDNSLIIEKLSEFAQMDIGGDFMEQLRGIYS